MITDHVWRPFAALATGRHRLVRLRGKCAYMNCLRSPAEHARLVREAS